MMASKLKVVLDDGSEVEFEADRPLTHAIVEGSKVVAEFESAENAHRIAKILGASNPSRVLKVVGILTA